MRNIFIFLLNINYFFYNRYSILRYMYKQKRFPGLFFSKHNNLQKCAFFVFATKTCIFKSFSISIIDIGKNKNNLETLFREFTHCITGHIGKPYSIRSPFIMFLDLWIYDFCVPAYNLDRRLSNTILICRFRPIFHRCRSKVSTSHCPDRDCQKTSFALNGTKWVFRMALNGTK